MTISKRVLIADDEPDICEMLSLVFKKNGYATHTAGDTDQALAAVRTFNPSCIISDIRMPRGGGMRLLEEVLKLPEAGRPPVLLITGYADVDREEAIRLGAADILQKPLRLRELVQRVEELIKVKVDA